MCVDYFFFFGTDILYVWICQPEYFYEAVQVFLIITRMAFTISFSGLSVQLIKKIPYT